MSKISGYANSVSSLGTDDLLDVSEKISSSPDVYESRKMTGAILAAFIQAYAQNILANDGLTMPANRSHDLQNFVLTLQNAGFAIEGAQTITAASAVADIFNLYDNTSTLLHRFNNAYISLFGGGVPAGSEKLLIADKTKITDRLELSGTTDGFLMPRLTTAQMNAIAAPTTNLLVFNTDLSAIYRYNGAAWVALSAGYGIVSVNDSSGIPTFYADLSSAHSAASSGDTIELHSDIVLTSQLSITKLLTIKMNGHNISFDSAGTDDTIYIAYSATGNDKFSFIGGGRIVRTGGSASLTNSLALHYAANDILDLGQTELYNDFGTALYLQSTKPTLGGVIWAESTAVRTAKGQPTKMYIYSNNGDGINANTNDFAVDCTIKAPNGSGCVNNASAKMCYIECGGNGIDGGATDVIGNTIIAGGRGIETNKSIDIVNNTIYSNTEGIYHTAVAGNICGNKIFSSDKGIYSANANEIEGNIIEASGDVGIFCSVGQNIRNNIVRVTWNNANGHAIQLNNPSTHDITGNYLEVANASAYGIYSTNAATFVYHFGNSYKGCTTKTSIATGNSQTNTEDTIGEILRG